MIILEKCDEVDIVARNVDADTAQRAKRFQSEAAH
jgi:hypothetical protein